MLRRLRTLDITRLHLPNLMTAPLNKTLTSKTTDCSCTLQQEDPKHLTTSDILQITTEGKGLKLHCNEVSKKRSL